MDVSLNSTSFDSSSLLIECSTNVTPSKLPTGKLKQF